MLEAIVKLFLFALRALLSYRHRGLRNALSAACTAIKRTVDSVHEPTDRLLDQNYKLRRQRELKRKRTLAFGTMLKALPTRHARRTVARTIRRHEAFAEYDFDRMDCWQPHVAKEPIVHDYLPLLYRVDAPRDEADWLPEYCAQRAVRASGEAVAILHKAERGTVTMPHTDKDRKGRPTGSVLALQCGEQLLVAWHESDLPIDELNHGTPHDDGECFAEWPDVLATVGSLTIISMQAGDAVEIDAHAVHMVVTTQSKRQITLSTYEPVPSTPRRPLSPSRKLIGACARGARAESYPYAPR